MSNLIVIVFDDAEQAGNVRATLKSVEHEGRLRLDDSAVVVKDEKGKIHVKDQMDRGVKVGAVTGGLLGILLASVFFPIGGLIIGAVAGGLIGSAAGLGISKSFIKEVSESMTENSSALFIIVRDGDPDLAVAALRPYQGKILQTTLSPEDEETLRRTLKKKG
ncbi:MAG: DUF1269 domain-containing protein [Chloroflexi bacterium]|jgi:uncharacterized membrane protein|nr:DUF1269 domain-containing protein [Chloroflexota bacterium]